MQQNRRSILLLPSRIASHLKLFPFVFSIEERIEELNPKSQRRLESFSHFEAESHLRHRNLVKIIGYAWESGKLKAFVSLFSITATIYVLAMARARKNLTFKELVSMIKRTWTRPAITLFYLILLGSGCSYGGF